MRQTQIPHCPNLAASMSVKCFRTNREPVPTDQLRLLFGRLEPAHRDMSRNLVRMVSRLGGESAELIHTGSRFEWCLEMHKIEKRVSLVCSGGGSSRP